MAEDGRADLAALARRAAEMRGELAQVKQDLSTIEGTGYGGGGLVAATVSGEGRLIGLRIDSSVIDPDDPGTLAALIIAAVDDAQSHVAERRKEHFAGVTDSVNGLLAGFNDGIGGVLAGLRENAARNEGAVPRVPDRSRMRPRGPQQGAG